MSYKKLLQNALGFSFVILLLVTCSTPQPAPTPFPPTPTDTSTPALIAAPSLSAAVRVLFIGNSLTFFNDLPDMFAELARSGGHEVEVDMSAHGGWTCSDHAESAMTLDMIEQQNWDFVVLQEGSTIPAIVDQRSEHMYPAIRHLDEKVGDKGAITVLFVAWASRDGLPGYGFMDYVAMQEEVQAGYMEIANELDAMVAPVGMAWQSAMTQDAQLSLWQMDGLHPTEEGTYLAALVFYAVFFQQSPEGLPYRAGLSEETAQFMQAVTAETVLADPERWNIP